MEYQLYGGQGASLYALYLGTLILLLFAYRVYSQPLAKLPGTELSKWTDVILKYHWLRGTRSQYVHSLHQQYGPVIRVGPREVSVCDIAAAKQIHSLKGGFVKSNFYEALVPGVQDVFSTRDIELHRRHRRLLTSPISDTSLKAVEGAVDAKVKRAIQRMAQERGVRGAADVFNFWLFMASDVISELSFGESFGLLEQGKKNQYVEDVEKLAALTGIATTFPTLVKLTKHIPIPFLQGPSQNAQRLREYAEGAIGRYKNYLSNNPASDKPMLFSRLFKAGDEGLTDAEIWGDAQAYIVAGSDTTANSLTYLVWAVCRDSTVKRRLVTELSELDENFGDSDLRGLPYLNQVIEETLRLYPAAPSALPRVVPVQGVTFCNQWIPGGVTISTQAWGLHRIPAVFPEPDRFNPSRWETPTKDMKDSFMPFGGGSRVCLGLHLARMELRLGAARFFRTFPGAKVSQLERMSDDDMVPLTYFLLNPKGKRCLIETV
ncbi:putative sterigmatocystin biosynthesis P450 monooxygenase STCB-like protein 7 [Colletotrichum chlorophyti]|uniref:Putative sterigmatocystin biosynthesis P450 monooxygenase STCB-like protein 7 n=1 Tax=Colletotrichum chlorophyti TaxID=708187 RepID=A0A1Q8S692_9PEZI|nr:putative sterigmatocystin biosynthesis P450 monooxygenase STCB-like protein 7 [Colletotrichum chlorophyti]